MSLQTTLGRIPLSLRLAAFRILEIVNAWRHPAQRASAEKNTLQPQQAPSVWFFVSTIGEVNAIEPFIRALLQTLGNPSLTLISDRDQYQHAYRAKFPDAHLAVLDGSHRQAAALAATSKPLLLVVAEIPCALHDAPCRFSFATVQAVRRAGAPAVLVNGWLYGYAPPSPMDRIENLLFAADYLRAFDLMLVQTTSVAERLVRAGAPADRVRVTGNIKFDAMSQSHGLGAASPLARALQARNRGPVIVAGSVTETADQRMLLEAFTSVCQEHPGALLVLAPRHPENVQRMSALRAELESRGLPWRLRSQHGDTEAADCSVLVIDTMGELRGCYSAANLAYVGTDHNVLEPLSFGKPVFVSGVWEPTYPSYPVYLQLSQAGVVVCVTGAAELAAAWRRMLVLQTTDWTEERQRLGAVLEGARGATERSMQAMQPLCARLATGPRD